MQPNPLIISRLSFQVGIGGDRGEHRLPGVAGVLDDLAMSIEGLLPWSAIGNGIVVLDEDLAGAIGGRRVSRMYARCVSDGPCGPVLGL